MGDLFGPTGLVVLQSTGFCNIDCRYCYLPDRANGRQTMDLKTVAQVARLIFDPSLLKDEIDIVWHAGEPLTLPPVYYDDAIRIIDAAKPSTTETHYGIQTNGTLIDDNWIDLFERHHIRLGISIDGPSDLHDVNRKYRTGAGSYDRVISGIRKLQARDYPFHIISVVTAPTLSRAQDLVRFYWQLRPTAIGLNVEEIEAYNQHSSLYDDASVKAFGRFVVELMNEAAGQDPPIEVRDFARTMSWLIAGKPEDNDQVVPLRIVNVAWNGDISTFSPELLALTGADGRRFIFGNVHDCRKLTDILDDERFRIAYAEICRGVDRCAEECEYFQFCGGGAPVNKLSETGRLDVAETVFCRLTKKTWVDVCLQFANSACSRFQVTATT
jgi:uncharacterized protein